jgi:hypothetical protein
MLVAFEPYGDPDGWEDATLTASLILRQRRPRITVGIVSLHRTADVRFEWGVADDDSVIWVMLNRGRLEWVRPGRQIPEELQAAADEVLSAGVG